MAWSRTGAEARKGDGGVPGGLGYSDWSSIRQAYEASRHVIRREADGHHSARNPGQQWRTEFDGRGFLVRPDHGAWTWGMELQSCGRQPICFARQPATAAGNELSYHWGENITEWFRNDRRGLEQGWTIQTGRADLLPASGGMRLTFKLRGALTPVISSDGSSIAFQKHKTTALIYGGLKAWDANHKALGVRFARGENEATLTIVVDDAEATYPITIDPVAQQAYLKASNTGAEDGFGQSVAISGDTVVVGAPNEDSAATGVNGDSSDNSLLDSGAAYIFVRSGANWSQEAYLKAAHPGEVDGFGHSVAISGDTVVIGARFEASAATGVNGNSDDDNAYRAGAAYIFVRTGETWSQEAYLKASNTGTLDRFGHSVAISGDTVIVGALEEASSATGVNGDSDDDNAYRAGAAYIFVRTGETWSQEAYLKASNTGAQDRFGRSVAISGDTAVVGAQDEASATPGVNGDSSDNSLLDSGAAYIFVRSGANWSQEAYLKASNPGEGDGFGRSVTISGDTVVVGAFGEDSAATGINGDDSDNSVYFSGAAYVFVRNETGWEQEAYLKASNTGANDCFGRSVAISGGSLVVGARYEESAATGVNGDAHDNSANRAGAAYIFARNEAGWEQVAYLKASNSGAEDRFGQSVAVCDDTVVVTATKEDSAATGVNGDGGDNSAEESGAAYLFDLDMIPSLPPIVITEAFLIGTDFTIRFPGEPGVTDWRVMGSVDSQEFTDDLTDTSIISETSPGRYEAVVTLSVLTGHYFLRIER